MKLFTETQTDEMCLQLTALQVKMTYHSCSVVNKIKNVLNKDVMNKITTKQRTALLQVLQTVFMYCGGV